MEQKKLNDEEKNNELSSNKVSFIFLLISFFREIKEDLFDVLGGKFLELLIYLYNFNIAYCIKI